MEISIPGGGDNTHEYWTFLKLAGQEANGESKRIPWKDVLGFQFEKWGGTEWARPSFTRCAV